MNPKKFAMWLFIGSVVMLFASLTSAYIVRQAEGNWLYFELPGILTVSTAIILLSSVTMQWAYWSAKKDNLQMVKILVSATFLLGILFLVLQFYGWKDLVASQVYLVGNPSGSFLYVITGLHGMHIISAIVFLIDRAGVSFSLPGSFEKPSSNRNVHYLLAFFRRSLALFVCIPIIVSIKNLNPKLCHTVQPQPYLKKVYGMVEHHQWEQATASS